MKANNGPVPMSLETGDRLTRAEFERRYEALPQVKKAELLEGVVYMPSPVRFFRHGRPNAHLVAWLVYYEAKTSGVAVGDNASARLDLDNEPQPDGMLIIGPECGGRAVVSEDDYIEGGPELAAEVSSSSVSIDLNLKLHVYRRNGVQEYLVWRVLDRQVDWFRLRAGQYERLAPDAAGVIRSEVFPGLWLDVPALLQGDMARVLTVLEQGTSQPEHVAFVERLRNARP
jgi:Uma2 family endonuclease